MARRLTNGKAPQGHPLRNGPAARRGATFQRGGPVLAGSRSGGKRITKGKARTGNRRGKR